MKDEKLSRILGREVLVGAELSAEDMQKILAAVPDVAPEAKKPEETVQAADQNLELINSITESVTASVTKAFEAKLNTIEERISKVEKADGSTSTAAPAAKGDHDQVEESYSTKMAKQMLNQ